MAWSDHWVKQRGVWHVSAKDGFLRRPTAQELKRYKEALAKGSRADVFAFFGDRKAEREAEKLEIEEWQLVEDIETLVSAPHRPFQLATRRCRVAVMRSSSRCAHAPFDPAS